MMTLSHFVRMFLFHKEKQKKMFPFLDARIRLTNGHIGSDTMLILKVAMVGSCRWNSRFVG